MTDQNSFRATARGWFRFRARPAPPIARRSPYESNPDRRLICSACTPALQPRSANWFAVDCPRCGGQAIEEMTAEERVEVQRELDSLRRPPLSPIGYPRPLGRSARKN